MTSPALFVSHSSGDSDIAQALVLAIDRAIKISARAVRCTSLPGYRLEGGVVTDATLRAEILNATAFIGIVTPDSLQSAYVLFELGARWGTGRHLLPAFARGADVAMAEGPLRALHILNLAVRDHVLQLVEEIANLLAVPLEPIATFDAAIGDVVRICVPPRAVNTPRDLRNKASTPRSIRPNMQVREVAMKKIREIVLSANTMQTVAALADAAGVSVEDATQWIREAPDLMFNRAPNGELRARVRS